MSGNAPFNMQEAQDAVDKAKATGDQKAEVVAKLQVSQFAIDAGDLKVAQTNATEARMIARKIGESKLEADAVAANVNVLAAIGEYEEATREAYDGLSICRRKGDEVAEGDALAMVVYAHHLSLSKEAAKKNKTQIEEDAFNEGVKELTQSALDSIKLFEKFNDQAKLARAYVSVAGVYMLSGEPDKAKTEAKKAYAMFSELKDGNGYYDACMALANAHLQRADLNSAIRYANEARELCVQFQDAWGTASCDSFIRTVKECIYAGNELEKVNGVLDMMRVEIA